MIRQIAWDLLRSSWRYLVLVLGGTSAYLIGAPVIGYLPYSDRPGPGWYGLFSGATLDGLTHSLGFVFGWALLAVPHSFFAILPTFSAVRIFEWAGFQRLLNATVGAALGGFTTLYFLAEMGWYIALDSFTPLLSASLGALFGAWLLPRPRSALSPRLTLARASGSMATLALLVWLIFPDALSSFLGSRKDSLTIDGTLHNGGNPVSFIEIRAFAHCDSCSGKFADSSTDEKGRFHFYRETLQENFPENGSCKYDVTVCYKVEAEWRKLCSAGRSGPCGAKSRIEFRCDLARVGDVKCDTGFRW